jgi:hypothetical protein
MKQIVLIIMVAMFVAAPVVVLAGDPVPTVQTVPVLEIKPGKLDHFVIGKTGLTKDPFGAYQVGIEIRNTSRKDETISVWIELFDAKQRSSVMSSDVHSPIIPSGKTAQVVFPILKDTPFVRVVLHVEGGAKVEPARSVSGVAQQTVDPNEENEVINERSGRDRIRTRVRMIKPNINFGDPKKSSIEMLFGSTTTDIEYGMKERTKTRGPRALELAKEQLRSRREIDRVLQNVSQTVPRVNIRFP